MFFKIVKYAKRKGLSVTKRKFNEILVDARKRTIKDNLDLFFHILKSLYDCYFNKKSLRVSRLKPTDNLRIKEEYLQINIKVVPYRIDVEEFEEQCSRYSFPKPYLRSYGNIYKEKLLEHYLSWKLLDFVEEDVFVDIAAADSPWYNILKNTDNINSYCLDLKFPKGINGNKIGANASNIPVKDGFFTKIALHCAFEAFENDSDTEFIREAGRVLKHGGKLIILPLYMGNFHYISSSPFTDRRGIKYGNAKLVYRDDGSMVRFARHYSVDAFINRVYKYCSGFNLKIYYIENEKEIDENCYVKFMAVFEKSVEKIQ